MPRERPVARARRQCRVTGDDPEVVLGVEGDVTGQVTAGTAVLVDEYGTPVVRCFCGNPLKPAVFTPTAKCNGCPPDYKPPRQCKYGRRGDYDETYYRRDYYSNGAYDEVRVIELIPESPITPAPA